MLLFLILLCNTIIYWVLNFSSSVLFLFFVFLFFALRQFRCSSHITYRRTFCASCVTCLRQFCAYGITCLRQFRCSSHITYRRTFCASCVTYPLQFCAYGITCLRQFCSLHITLRVLFALPVLLACVSFEFAAFLCLYFLS